MAFVPVLQPATRGPSGYSSVLCFLIYIFNFFFFSTFLFTSQLIVAVSKQVNTEYIYFLCVH